MTDRPSIRIADPRERAGAFRRAKINTIFVRTMRVLLPVSAVVLLSSYAVFMQRQAPSKAPGARPLSASNAQAGSFDDLAMTNPSYEGFSKKDGSQYKVSANRAITDLSRDKPIRLQGIDALFKQAGGYETLVKAARGMYDQKLGTLDLKGGIDLRAPNGMRVALNSATIDTNSASIVSNQPVQVETPSVDVRSNAMLLDQKARKIWFKDGVAATLRPATLRKDDKRKEPSQAFAAFGAGSSQPVKITAGALVISEKERTAEFSANVKAVQNGRSLSAPKLVVAFTGGPNLTDVTNTVAATKQQQPTPTRLRQIIARDGLELCEGGQRITAKTAIFDAETNKAELIGDVRIKAPGNGTIAADRVRIDQKTNRIVLTGQVVARQADNLLRGGRLDYQPKKGELRLTSPSLRGTSAGRIFARFRQPGRANRKRTKRARPASLGMAFSTDPDAPIEITSQTMQASDPASVVRFSGDVQARQGDLILTTASLNARYLGKLGLQADANQGRSRNANIKLRVIEAPGPVSVKSGTDIQADGDRAVFNLAGNKVTLSGNVVLRQGRQIIRGQKLVIDLKTGIGRMQNAPSGKAPRPMQHGAPPSITANPKAQACGGRMCAVLYPGDVRRQRGQRPNDTRARPPQGSGWTTSTTN